MGLFSPLTAAERSRLARKLLSASGQLIDEKMRLRRCGDAYARAVYGTDAGAYVAAIDDVHAVTQDVLGSGSFVPTGTGWPVA